MDDVSQPASRTLPPSNAFVPVPGCWVCTSLYAVADAAWRGEDGLSLRKWLTVTASGMRHRMVAHGLSPSGGGEASEADEGRLSSRPPVTRGRRPRDADQRP
jgi:hypothetical protein